MKYTDRFFSFPIKVYDTTLTNDKLLEAQLGNGAMNKDEVDWVAGIVRLPYHVWQSQALYWYEGYSKGRTPEEVAKEGADLTIVICRELGEFVCTWERKKFEDRLNQYMDSMEQVSRDEVEMWKEKMAGTPIQISTGPIV